MKLHKLINQLNALAAKHGDADVAIEIDTMDNEHSQTITGELTFIVTRLDEKRVVLCGDKE